MNPSTLAPTTLARTHLAAGLAVEHLTIRFGGATAVNDFSFEAPLGHLTGLCGPNGAGKTTTFNACSGLLRPATGRVHLFGADVTTLTPSARARLGLGRTFQRMELFDSLSVRQNVRLGREAAMAGRNPLRQVFSTRKDRQAIAEAVEGAIGLCGPNGAGKTTTFNACSGLLRPAAGRVHLFGVDVTTLAPSARARLGLGRTFQRVELFDSLSVRQNVRLGREAAMAGRNPLRQVFSTRKDRQAIAEAVEGAIGLCGVGEIADRKAGSLSTGQRRLVELARALAGDFRFLLLDEPSSGLDKSETKVFGEILRRVVEDHGTGILLVEHDMDLVMSVCDHIYVLDFGQLIFDGTPTEMQHSEVVRAAYLGDESVA